MGMKLPRERGKLLWGLLMSQGLTGSALGSKNSLNNIFRKLQNLTFNNFQKKPLLQIQINNLLINFLTLLYYILKLALTVVKYSYESVNMSVTKKKVGG